MSPVPEDSKLITSPDKKGAGSGMGSDRRVWDPLVRILHWAQLASVAMAWLTHKGGGAWHECAGYASLLLIALRIAWGWAGSRYAHFGQFVRSPGVTLYYARQLLARNEPRYIGHNPLGGWMILLMITNLVLVGFSGWLYTTDAYWGEQWLESAHNALAWSLVVLIAMHLAGVAVTSYRHAENLVGAMLHGRKRPPSGDDVA